MENERKKLETMDTANFIKALIDRKVDDTGICLCDKCHMIQTSEILVDCLKSNHDSAKFAEYIEKMDKKIELLKDIVSIIGSFIIELVPDLEAKEGVVELCCLEAPVKTECFSYCKHCKKVYY
jgi:predicted site-specific integrase-resolvase